jgi:hypothetical protein
MLPVQGHRSALKGQFLLPLNSGRVVWWVLIRGNIESNTARSSARPRMHSAKVSAFLPETWAAADSSQRSGPFYVDDQGPCIEKPAGG